jgi:hypothetical protein
MIANVILGGMNAPPFELAIVEAMSAIISRRKEQSC